MEGDKKSLSCKIKNSPLWSFVACTIITDNNCNCNENIRTHHVEKVMFYAHLSKLERWASLKIKIPFCSRYSSSWPCTPTCALEVVLPAPVFVLPRNGSHLSFPTFYLPICPLHPVEEGTVMSLNWTHFDERNFKIISWNFGHRVFCGVVSFKVYWFVKCHIHTYYVELVKTPVL